MQITQQSNSRKLFEFITDTCLDPDTLYSNERLSAVIEKPIQRYRTALYTAVRLLEKEHNRTLVCVTRVGYRVARANESRDIADSRVTRASRQVRRGLHTTVHTEVTMLTQEERRQLDQTRVGLIALERQMTQIRREIKHVEARVDLVETTHDERLQRLEEEISALRAERNPDA